MSIYLTRYAYPHQLIEHPPIGDVGIIVVIPCYHEPDLIQSLESLAQCELPLINVEVLVVINHAEDASDFIKAYNQNSFKTAKLWAEQNNTPELYFHILQVSLPTKKAGVGLARKAGMDEAVRRFEAVGNPEGIICCFDADSTCDTNYLQAVYEHFELNAAAKGASIYYEHDTEVADKALGHGITQYELHLRYYVNALRFAGFPFAYQTVGSSMAVKASIYQKQGGMNTRKAGEDFYFLNKIIPLGDFTEINTTTVRPSGRVSDRVPFGTGRFMSNYLEGDTEVVTTYHIQSFLDLKACFDQVSTLFRTSGTNLNLLLEKMPESILNFVPLAEFNLAMEEINRQSTTQAMFLHRFFLWFNAFKVLKYMHFARDNYYPNIDITSACQALNEQYAIGSFDNKLPKELLEDFRRFDRIFKSA
jgi:hypothetical protein